MVETIWKRNKKSANAYCPVCKARTMIPAAKVPTITEKLHLSKDTKRIIYVCSKCGLTNE